MRIIENVVSDRGSKYAVSGGAVHDRASAAAFLADLRRIKKFAKATHNTWAVLFDDGGQLDPQKNDDGEGGGEPRLDGPRGEAFTGRLDEESEREERCDG